VGIHPLRFDKELEREFLKSVSEAYFLLGDDVNSYLEKLRQDIVVVHTFETLGPARMKDDAANRSEAMGRIHKFYETGRPWISHPPVRSEPTQPSNEKGAPDVGLVSEASCATEVRH
jgi:hypothetical protein